MRRPDGRSVGRDFAHGAGRKAYGDDSVLSPDGSPARPPATRRRGPLPRGGGRTRSRRRPAAPGGASVPPRHAGTAPPPGGAGTVPRPVNHPEASVLVDSLGSAAPTGSPPGLPAPRAAFR